MNGRPSLNYTTYAVSIKHLGTNSNVHRSPGSTSFSSLVWETRKVFCLGSATWNIHVSTFNELNWTASKFKMIMEANRGSKFLSLLKILMALRIGYTKNSLAENNIDLGTGIVKQSRMETNNSKALQLDDFFSFHFKFH